MTRSITGPHGVVNLARRASRAYISPSCSMMRPGSAPGRRSYPNGDDRMAVEDVRDELERLRARLARLKEGL